MSESGLSYRLGSPRVTEHTRRQCGTTFVELMGAISIISLATLVMLQQLTISYREGNIQHERLWAYDKCTQIMSELQSQVERGVIDDAEALQALADEQLNPVLTTVTDERGAPLAPDHPMSGNWQRSGRWLWARQIQVTSPPGQDRIRHVALRVVRYAEDGTPVHVAALTTLLTLPRRTYASTIVYDVYVLALGECPSLLGGMPALRSSVESMARAAAVDAPGIEFRLHFITRLGYGRDLLYTPYFNTATDAASSMPSVYWYPDNTGGGTRNFIREYFTGRYQTDDGVANDYDSVTRPHPHAVADQFNNCLRLPAALAVYDQRVAAGLEDPSAPPLQILLADMAEHPDRYRNAIVLNLHGDAVPFPPVRNYSDAASAPETVPQVRAVTHSAWLHTPRDPNGDGNNGDSTDVELRVHAYQQDASAPGGVLTTPITVQIFGGDLRPHLSIRRLPGGVDLASGAPSSTAPYDSFDSIPGLAPSSNPGNFAMWYETGYSSVPAPYTWIRLHNTPTTCPSVLGRGLPTSRRLYGMEYVPSPLGSVVPFSVDLSTSGTTAKNTARWRIRVNKTALGAALPASDQMLTVTTRIGTNLATGTAWPTVVQPRNQSTTYTWWTRTAEAVPFLERSQFLGDPRHNPYADVAANVRYNCYFAGAGIPAEAAAWPGIDATRVSDTGFGDGVTFDVPRVAEAWRDTLQKTGAIWVNLGPLASRFLLGGEIAAPSSDQGSLPSTVLMPGGLFEEASPVAIDTVSSSATTAALPPPETFPVWRGEQIVLGPGNFWTKPWVGELCADESYSEWFATGNVKATGVYRRVLRSQSTPPDLPLGAVFYGVATGATAGAIGGTAWMQCGTASATFAHGTALGSTASLTRDGRVTPKLLGFETPSLLGAIAPHSLTATGNAAAPHFNHPVDYPAQTVTLLESHLSSSTAGFTNGGVYRLADSAAGTAFVEIVGMTPGSYIETNAAIELGLSHGVRAFQVAGSPALVNRVEQVGRVEIVEPPKGGLVSNPSAITVTWRVDFLGFDGTLPTTAYSTGFTEDEGALRYSLLYSRDGGKHWFYALDNQPAQVGVRPPPAMLIADAGTGNETVSMPTPTGLFAAGDLLLRVEAYHATRGCHLGHHTVLVSLTR